MNKTFWVSLCYQGAHGGGLYLQENGMVFKTGKLQLPDNIKSMNIRYNDIQEVSPCSSLVVFPAFILKLKNGSNYKFIAFNRSKILRLIRSKLAPAV